MVVVVVRSSVWRAKVKLSTSGLLAASASGINTPYLTDYSFLSSMHPPSTLPLTRLQFPALDFSSSIVLFLCLNQITLFHFLQDHGVRQVRCGHDQPVAPYRPFRWLPYYPYVEKKTMLTSVLFRNSNFFARRR